MTKEIQKKQVKGLLSQLRSAAETLKAQIQQADEKIATLQKELSKLSDAPMSKEDCMGFVRKDIQRRASNYPNRLKRFGKNSGFPFFSFIQLERNQNAGISQPFPYLDGEGPHDGGIFDPSALYWIFGDLIIQRFSDALDQFQWPENPIAMDIRRTRINEINQELEELNEERDELAADLMSTGMYE